MWASVWLLHEKRQTPHKAAPKLDLGARVERILYTESICHSAHPKQHEAAGNAFGHLAICAVPGQPAQL